MARRAASECCRVDRQNHNKVVPIFTQLYTVSDEKVSDRMHSRLNKSRLPCHNPQGLSHKKDSQKEEKSKTRHPTVVAFNGRGKRLSLNWNLPSSRLIFTYAKGRVPREEWDLLVEGFTRWTFTNRFQIHTGQMGWEIIQNLFPGLSSAVRNRLKTLGCGGPSHLLHCNPPEPVSPRLIQLN